MTCGVDVPTPSLLVILGPSARIRLQWSLISEGRMKRLREPTGLVPGSSRTRKRATHPERAQHATHDCLARTANAVSRCTVNDAHRSCSSSWACPRIQSHALAGDAPRACAARDTLLPQKHRKACAPGASLSGNHRSQWDKNPPHAALMLRLLCAYALAYSARMPPAT
jgi:hypothetical protein